MTLTDLRGDLNDHLTGDFIEVDPEQDQPPVLDGIDAADRALRRHRDAESEVA